MKVQIKQYSPKGHDVLLEYDPATADMKEVNAELARIEKITAGRTFADSTGEVVTKVSRETGDMTHVRPIAGG